MYAIEQEEHTHTSGVCTSRLDRCYINLDPTNFQDRTAYCIADDWCKHLSDHRPIKCGIRVSKREDWANAPIPAYVYADTQWRTRLGTLLKQHSTEGMGALLRLRLLKWAMKKAAE